MARLARLVIPGIPHHITQRGNYQQQVFFRDEDYQLYLNLLAARAARYGVRFLGYCLMPNHVHLIAIPEAHDSLAKALGRAHCDFARVMHIRKDRTGHLWQNRFFSCPLDEAHCWEALRYVEVNPVRAHLAKATTDWQWSSAGHHLMTARNSSPLPLETATWSERWTPEHWQMALESGFVEAQWLSRLREATRTGRPFGSTGFTQQLEETLHRPLAPRKPGRKPKIATAQAATA